MANQELVKKCYDWQKDNIKSDSWAKRVKEELEKIGLASIWQNQYEYNNSAMYRVVKGRCDDIERQNLFSRLSEKISLVFYQEMKQAPASRPALGPTQPSIQWVPGVLSPGVKRGRGVTLTTHPHLVPRLSTSRSYTASPPMCLHGV
jgi:hypothetical protein